MASRSFPTVGGEEIWRATGPPGSLDGTVGYSLCARDGAIGTVIAVSGEVGRGYLLATGGAWNEGRTFMLPPGVVERVDRDERVVHVSCSREQVRGAPPFENDRYQDAAYRLELGGHYVAARPRAAGTPAYWNAGLSAPGRGR
jgi:hypothetical protein